MHTMRNGPCSFLLLLWTSSWLGCYHAFAPRHHHHPPSFAAPHTGGRRQTTLSALSALPDPNVIISIMDAHSWTSAVAVEQVQSSMQLLSSSSPTWLSDAATAVTADAMLPTAATTLPPLDDALSSAVATAVSNAMDAVATSTSSSSSSMDVLPDATGLAATEEEGGWWQSYLNIFKSALILVHSAVDPPLRSMGITQTWGVSIAIFTASVRALLVPLSIQQSKSSEYMKALKPYMNEIRDKFKNNKDMQNRAIAKLMEDAKQNPLAGCFVSLAQLPIFLGLYRGVRLLAMEGQLQEPFLWIPSLEGPVSAETDYRGLDWLLQGWTQDPISTLPVPALGWETTLAFLIMPVVLVLGQSLTMRVLQPPIDDNMSAEEKETMEKSQGVLKFLPLLIGFFSLQVPAGLTIYWFTSNIFTLLQSLGVRAYYAANPPKIELPDYWDALDDVANMTPEERRKAAEAGISTGPSFEDLLDEARFHYIVQRQPLRVESTAWHRAQGGGGESSSISSSSSSVVTSNISPVELQEWAGVTENNNNNNHADISSTSASQQQQQQPPKTPEEMMQAMMMMQGMEVTTQK